MGIFLVSCKSDIRHSFAFKARVKNHELKITFYIRWCGMWTKPICLHTLHKYIHYIRHIPHVSRQNQDRPYIVYIYGARLCICALLPKFWRENRSTGWNRLFAFSNFLFSVHEPERKSLLLFLWLSLTFYLFLVAWASDNVFFHHFKSYTASMKL